MPLTSYLHRVMEGEDLSREQARAAMELMLSGGASTTQMAAFLVALRMKGETAEELLGFAEIMRAKAVRVPVAVEGPPLVDTCGTGGDGQATLNVSTAAAFVVAGAGARVAKHGNRSLSSRCGSADLLEAMGVEIALPPERMGRAIDEIGIGFLFAPLLHPAVRHAQAARLELKTRTVFNLLGPLANPAGAPYQLMGTFSAWAAELQAKALAGLGIRRALVVHASDGLDEITLGGETLAFSVEGGRVKRGVLRPEDFGLPQRMKSELKGGRPEENRELVEAVLQGKRGAARDVVVANAAAALVVAELAPGYREGARLAAEAIDSGKAWEKVQQLVAFSRAAQGGSEG